MPLEGITMYLTLVNRLVPAPEKNRREPSVHGYHQATIGNYKLLEIGSIAPEVGYLDKVSSIVSLGYNARKLTL